MTFLDTTGGEIDCYNPYNDHRDGPVHEIADKEELIGVYGVRDKKGKKCFSSFGFIVKVKQD